MPILKFFFRFQAHVHGDYTGYNILADDYLAWQKDVLNIEPTKESIEEEKREKTIQRLRK